MINDETIKAVDNQLCDDTISRKDTLKAMILQLGIRNEDYLLPAEATLYKVVKNMPSVIPKSKTGHWIKYDNEYFTAERLTPLTHSIMECSECHTKIADFCGEMKYCPNCGVKMQEVEE